ncbi:hypothetical protein RFI_18865, partial [Reticulomyxa filosa]
KKKKKEKKRRRRTKKKKKKKTATKSDEEEEKEEVYEVENIVKHGIRQKKAIVEKIFNGERKVIKKVQQRLQKKNETVKKAKADSEKNELRKSKRKRRRSNVDDTSEEADNIPKPPLKRVWSYICLSFCQSNKYISMANLLNQKRTDIVTTDTNEDENLTVKKMEEMENFEWQKFGNAFCEAYNNQKDENIDKFWNNFMSSLKL